MNDHGQPDAVAALVALAARVDALTWVAGALLQSHQNPRVVLEAWTQRLPDAADSGFEIDATAYRERFQQELQLWTGTLQAEARRQA